jgi:hypothetical protein
MFGVIDDFPPLALRKSTLSAIMARFSSRVLSMMDSTCRGQLFPKMAAVGVPLS